MQALHGRFIHYEKGVQALHGHFIHYKKAMQALHDHFTHCEKGVQALHSHFTHCDGAVQVLHDRFTHCDDAVQVLHSHFTHCEKAMQALHSHFTHCDGASKPCTVISHTATAPASLAQSFHTLRRRHARTPANAPPLQHHRPLIINKPAPLPLSKPYFWRRDNNVWDGHGHIE